MVIIIKYEYIYITLVKKKIFWNDVVALYIIFS